MSLRTVLRHALAFIALAVGCTIRSPATAGQIHLSDRSQRKVVTITVCPAPEPSPALRYRLVPSVLAQVQGNAAVYYGKASADEVLGSKDFWRAVERWRNTPLKKLADIDPTAPNYPDRRPPDPSRDMASDLKYYKLVTSDDWTVIECLRRAARSEYCDWQLHFRHESFYTVTLAELNDARRYARLLHARAKLFIAARKFDKALEALRIGYALGRHVSEGGTFIHLVLGVSICRLMTETVLDLIQQPNSPNLYWAIAELPQPLLDWQRAANVELSAVYVHFPVLQRVEQEEGDERYWRRELLQTIARFDQLVRTSEAGSDPTLKALLAALAEYPYASQRFLQRGFTDQELTRMPVGRLILLDAKLCYDEISQAYMKSLYLPFPHAARAWAGFWHRYRPRDSKALPFASTLLPPAEGAYTALTLCDREIAVLRLIEALRSYTAEHNGALPDTLSDLTLYVPPDPVTDRSFQYTLVDGKAVIKGPPLRGKRLHIELHIRHQ